jgi:hypothetical protein
MSEVPTSGKVSAERPDADVEEGADTARLESSEPEAPAESGVHRLYGAFRAALPALAGYAAVRLVGLLVLWNAVPYARPRAAGVTASLELLARSLSRYDGGHYLVIASEGYDTGIRYVDGELDNTNITFFPLLPLLIRIVSLTGMPTLAAGLVVAALSALAAAWGIYAVGEHLHSRQLGIMLVILWAALPHAIVQNMVYTESLFTALVAWTLLALLRERWLLAGVLGCLGGLTRPTGPTLVGTVVLVCLVAVIRNPRNWRAWAAGALAPVGWVAYVAWVGVVLGRADGYFWMNREGWQNEFDFGVATTRAVLKATVDSMALAYYGAGLVTLVAVALLAVLIFQRRWPLPVIVYSVAGVALAALQGGDYFYAKGRFLVPVFTLLIPVALALVGTSRSTRWIVVGTLVAISTWYGVYLIFTWTASP